MNFLLDENFPKKAVDILKVYGHQTFDIRGTELEGCKDTVIFEKSQKEKAVFLTTDRDFFHTIPPLFKSHCGIVVIALSQPNAVKILEKLQIALKYMQNVEFNSKVLLFTDSKIAMLSK